MMKKSLLAISLALVLALSCTQNQTMKTEEKIESKVTKPVIYQMMTRLFANTNTNNVVWGTLEENGVSKFDDINETALDEIKKMGFTHVWYTGILEHAVLTDYTAHGIPLDDADVVKGRAGSPYAIKDYYDVNPDLANDVPNRKKEFLNLVERTHNKGMKVLIDFIPNHVARYYSSDAKPEGVVDLGADDDNSLAFDVNNNFYYLPGTSFQVPEGYNSLGDNEFPTKDGKFDESPAKATGNDVFRENPSVYDWFETIKLNYGVDYQDNRTKYFNPIPDTWKKMTNILLYWASQDVDGFRCDMAEMVPVEFWNYAIGKVKDAYPDVIFVAEIYNPAEYRNYIQIGGFDYLYDKVELYDTLKHIIQYKASTDDITAIWQRQEGIAGNMLTFLENHDEQRIACPEFAGDPWKAIPAMVLSATMNVGPVMVYYGQEVGEPGKGPEGFGGDDGRTTIFDYWGVPEHQKWVNGGAFDGGALSDDQKRLRGFYSELLNLCNQSSAIKEGGFFDLHYYNRNNDFTGYSNRIYSYLRHSEDEVLLFVLNFGQEEELAHVKIPQHAVDSAKLGEAPYVIEEFYNWNEKVELTKEQLSNYDQDGLKARVGANSYKIYKIRK